MKKKYTLVSLFLLSALVAFSQVPDGYYTGVTGKKGDALLTAFYNVITNHTNVGYDGLFDVYKDSDLRPDGKIWDMYSNITNFSIGDHSSYHAEGDCYNREHSVPQSWFSKANPMKSDAFHVIPVDGYVNNRRSNYPYGETTRPTYTSANSFSKVGPCAVSGYSGTCFEPNDEYKGDIARIYFYMATAYADKAYNWNSEAFGGTKTQPFSAWTLRMLLQWSADDPVSQKEIDRNNGVYKHQKNRNPFVDFPGLEQYIWGDKRSIAFDASDFGTGSGEDQKERPQEPVFSVPSGSVTAGTEVDIECPDQDAVVCYTINGLDEERGGSIVTITITENTHIVARSYRDGRYSAYVTADYTVAGSSTEPYDGNHFLRVTREADLQEGRRYLIVCEQTNSTKIPEQTALAAQSNDVRSWAEVSIVGTSIDTQTGGEYPHTLTLGGHAGAWTFYDASENVYLGLSSSANKLHALDAATTDNARWTIDIDDDGTAHISSVAYDNRQILFNASSPRFACYTSSQRPVTLYVMDRPTGIEAPEISLTSPITESPAYDLQGRRTSKNRQGVYISGGRIILH